MKKYTTKEFIQKAKEIHNDKYDYSLVYYINSAFKIKIICKEHGVFEQSPNTHLSKRGCIRCFDKKRGQSQKLNTTEFIKKAKQVHGNKYDYSLVEYIKSSIPIIIICSIHKEFKQTPNKHLIGHNCPKCNNKNKTTEEFIEQLKIIHNNVYDYSLVNYKGNKQKIKIICKKHGEFEQIAAEHLRLHGCPKCKSDKATKTTEEFIQKAKQIHSDKYDYTLVNYIHCDKKIKIICKEHGEFEQTPHIHLNDYKCSKCNSYKGERIIQKYLENNNIKYEFQKMFNECKYKRKLPFDFYLADYNLCIEFDGKQHFIPIEYYGGEKTFKITILKDEIKNNYCLKNNIKLLRISYTDIKRIEEILKINIII